jgi:Holliday junction resolvasome RuvABC endonuclease subunit
MAVDPTLRHTGVALGHVELGAASYGGHLTTVESIHLLETEKTTAKTVRKNSDDLRCARQLIEELTELRRRHQPVVTFVEVPSGSQTARSSWTLGITLGIIAGFSLPVVELTPVEVKKGFASDKTASKDTMIQLATGQHPDLAWLRHGGRLIAKNEHLADAVAVLHVGAASVQFRELTRMLEVAA